MMIFHSYFSLPEGTFGRTKHWMATKACSLRLPGMQRNSNWDFPTNPTAWLKNLQCYPSTMALHGYWFSSHKSQEADFKRLNACFCCLQYPITIGVSRERGLANHLSRCTTLVTHGYSGYASRSLSERETMAVFTSMLFGGTTHPEG